MQTLRSIWFVWFDRVACGLFGLLAFGAMFLPELCVWRNADGIEAGVFGIIVDPPTGESIVTTVYSPFPFVLLFAVGSFYYLFRVLFAALRPNQATTNRRPRWAVERFG